MGGLSEPTEQPLVTIAMPVHNAAVTLDAAVRSILAQTYRNWRLVVVDDGSSDLTGQIINSHADERIQYVTDDRNLGLSARLNQIIDSAESDYLARLDADDVAYPERLEKQVTFMERHTDVDMVGSAALLFRADGSIEGVLDVESGHEQLAARLWQGFRIPHPSWLGRFRWFKQFRYDPRMSRAQDQELLLRALPNSRYACIPEILIGYRKAEEFLGKRLTGRAYLTHSLISYALRTHHYGMLPRIVAEQVAKGMFDGLMAMPIIGKHIVHPAGRPVTIAETERWGRVAHDVQLTARKA